MARRERIITTTRALIGEIGIEGITMRNLAQRCDVAVATLYNQFGSREAIIAAALQMDFVGRYAPLSELTAALDPASKVRERIILAARAITGPLRDYTSSVMFFYFHHKPDSTIRAAIHDVVVSDFLAIAGEIDARDELQPWVRIEIFCDDLITQLYALVTKWSQGHISDRRLQGAADAGCGHKLHRHLAWSDTRGIRAPRSKLSLSLTQGGSSLPLRTGTSVAR